MRGCVRTGEKRDEQERFSMLDYILFIDIHKCANTKERNACAFLYMHDCLGAFH